MPASDFTHDDVTRMLRLIDDASDIELRIEVGDMKLHMRKFSGASPSPSPSPAAAAAPALETPQPFAAPAALQPAPSAPPPTRAAPAAAKPDEGLIAVRAPMLGRFYRTPSPSEPPFVEVGTHVEPDDTLCLVEVMKLFNTVPAGVRGTVTAFLVEHNAMVEEDQILVTIRPDAPAARTS